MKSVMERKSKKTGETSETLFETIRVPIIKPVDGRDWKDLGKMLREAAYRCSRVANMLLSENYAEIILARRGKEFEAETQGRLNRELWGMLQREWSENQQKKKKGTPQEPPVVLAAEGALPATVIDALFQYKVKQIITGDKMKKLMRADISLASFRRDMAVPIRCDRDSQRRVQRMPDGTYEVELMVCNKPYPRVMLASYGIGDSALATLERLTDQESGYKQRNFEVKWDDMKRQWMLHISYSFPKNIKHLDKNKILGVDVGFACPLYASVSGSEARIGHRKFDAIGASLLQLRRQIQKRRAQYQAGNQIDLSGQTSRAGHGRGRALQSTEKLYGKVVAAKTRLNHQMASAIVSFAVSKGCGVIQIPDYSNLKHKTRGTFLGQNWAYYQLINNIVNKSKENGIEVMRPVPQYTSRRCSDCGHINVEFTREYRNEYWRKTGRTAQLICKSCGKQHDPDYNAARNFSIKGIEQIIRQQCKRQGVKIVTKDE